MHKSNSKAARYILSNPTHVDVGTEFIINSEGEKIANSFLSAAEIRQIREKVGSPVFIYSKSLLEFQALQAMSMPSAFGHTARYAMKACPNLEVLRTLHSSGIKIDASSGHEVQRAISAGIPASDIKLTAQQLPANLESLVESGIRFNACSLLQLDVFGSFFPGGEISIRINPGLGSGHNQRTNVGGVSSSFGIWHEDIEQVKSIAKKHRLVVNGIHSHIGSGSDADIWDRCAELTLSFVHEFPEVQTVNLGGGFKVARMPDEKSTDIHAVGEKIAKQFEQFKQTDKQSRELHLEIEPGSYFLVNSGALLASIIDVKSTGAKGYEFLLLDSGMTEILRPGLYGAQHPLTVVPLEEGPREKREYLVAGHCCESGDILTPAEGDPEGLLPRLMLEASPGDLMLIGGAGAYCSSMSALNYNSFPKAAEVMLDGEKLKVIARRQMSEEVFALDL